MASPVPRPSLVKMPALASVPAPTLPKLAPFRLLNALPARLAIAPALVIVLPASSEVKTAPLSFWIVLPTALVMLAPA